MTIQGLVGVFSSSLSWENIIITSILGFIVYYYLSHLSQQHRTRNQGRTLLDTTSNPTAAATTTVTDDDNDNNDDNDEGKNGSGYRRCDLKAEKEERRQRMFEEERERMIEKRCELFDHNKKKDSDNENSDADVNNVDPISRSGTVIEAACDDPAISSSVAASSSTTNSFEQIEEEGGGQDDDNDNDVDEKEESLSSFELISSENIISDNNEEEDDDDDDKKKKKEENDNDDKLVDTSSSSEVLALSIEITEEDEEAIVAATNQNDEPPQSDPNNEIMTTSTSIVAAIKDDDDNDDTDLFGLPVHSPTTVDTSPSTKNVNTHDLTSFHIWHDAIANIHRLYNIGPKEQDNEQNTMTIPPQPKSERGYLPVQLRIMNQSSMTIQVYWLDFQGREEWKGIIPPYGGVWNQTTWIGHPWIFRELKNHSDDNDEDEQQYQRYNRYSDGNSGRVLLHFIPYRVIPTTENVVTVTDHGDALQSFTFHEPPTTEGYHVHNSTTIDDNNNDSPSCTIVDNVFTYPSSNIRTPYKAIQFSCDQLRREDISPRILLKYLYNIQRHPYESKYRIIRVSNKVFWDNVWINGGRGILHALGFVEVGPYLKMNNDDGDGDGDGDDGEIVSFKWMDLLSNTISILEELRDEIDGDGQSFSTGQRKRIIRQPPGADGSGETGRAGWG